MSLAAKSFITSVQSDTTVQNLSDSARNRIMDSLRQQHGRAIKQLKKKFPSFFATAEKKSQEIDKKVSTKVKVSTNENSNEVPEDPAKEEEKIQGKIHIVEEKFSIVEEKCQAAVDKVQPAPTKSDPANKINSAIQQSQILKDLKEKFLALISAPDLPWTLGETLDFDTFQITFTVKTK